uniref:Uncharacterized protein n=1 Tax=Erwinia amylovora ATCC BAA-2158 TaxID=889211 RepID=E5BAL0_ERWAM|nr:hypothetical protein predicted by Glimmer/Critica [Erwinia amylovora ATCC BAA-2158]
MIQQPNIKKSLRPFSSVKISALSQSTSLNHFKQAY